MPSSSLLFHIRRGSVTSVEGLVCSRAGVCWLHSLLSPSWQAEVRPKCGRLVAFSSGKENPHGVWAVSRGRRCAIALWYTHSQEHAEQVKGHAGETNTSK